METNVTQVFTFSFAEIISQMIKAAAIHEGKWTLVVNCHVDGGNLSTADNGIQLPGWVFLMKSLTLAPALPQTPPNLVVHAADVWGGKVMIGNTSEVRN